MRHITRHRETGSCDGLVVIRFHCKCLNRIYQIQPGYPGIQHSGKAINFAPLWAASAMRLQVFTTPAARSSHSGSAWVTATRVVSDDIVKYLFYSGKKYIELNVRDRTAFIYFFLPFVPSFSNPAERKPRI